MNKQLIFFIFFVSLKTAAMELPLMDSIGQLTYEPDLLVLKPYEEPNDGPKTIEEFIKGFNKLRVNDRTSKVLNGTIYADCVTGRTFPVLRNLTTAQLNEILKKLDIPDCCD